MYYKYDEYGYLFEQGNSIDYVGDTPQSYSAPNAGAWRQIQTMTPAGQIGRQRYRNGLTQTMAYYPATWQMQSIDLPSRFAGSAPLMDYDYQYDVFGNLIQQTRHSLDGMSVATIDHETFEYDHQHRMRFSRRLFDDGQMQDIEYNYDALGNITSKDDYGSGYQYTGTRCEAGNRPNAVNSLNLTAGGTASYSYDCNGNMLTGPDRTITYGPHNKPNSISTGSGSNEFWYDADQQRYLQIKNGTETTVYLDKLYERKGNVHKLYIDEFAVFTVDYAANGEDTGITYLHGDRLGSMAVMSSGNGDMVPDASRGFDPFGKPRDGGWMDGDSDLNGYDETTRGFTGHEHLNETDLIHMNGRAYDYNLGRFLSVDPFIQFPTNSQSLNPYSYIMNNPLAGTDPTGYLIDVGKGCYSFISSCDVTELNGTPDERAARSNGKGPNSTQGTVTPGSVVLDEIGAGDNNSPDNALNVVNQGDGVDPDADSFGADIENGQRVAGDCFEPGCQREEMRQKLRGLQDDIETAADIADAVATPDAIDIVTAPVAPLGALNKARKGVDAARDMRRASEAKRSAFDIETGEVNLKASRFGLKVDGPIPESVPNNLTSGQLDEAIASFKTSIASRKAELKSFDAVGADNPRRLSHAQRISEEEAFLSQLKKARGN